MKTFGELIRRLSQDRDDPIDTADPKMVKRWGWRVNQAYQIVAAEYDWPELAAETTLDDTDLIEPGDVLVERSVRDGDGYFYYHVHGAKEPSQYCYNWYHTPGLTAVLKSGTDASVNEYGTAVTSAASFTSTTCAGEYIRIGDNDGIYKISAWTSTSAITLTDNFRGPKQSTVPFWIRPADVKTMSFSDEDGESYSPSGIVLRYTKRPLPLFQNYDLCLLPGDCEAVAIKALQLCLRGRAVTEKEGQYQRALQAMKGAASKKSMMAPAPIFVSRTNRDSRTLRNQLIGYP